MGGFTRRGIIAALMSSSASAAVFRPGRSPGFKSGLQFLATGAVAVFTMGQIATQSTNAVFQRTTQTGGGQGVGQGTIPVPITATTGGPIYAQRRSATDGVTILQSSWLAGTAVTGAQTFLVTGVDAPAMSGPTTPAAANDGYFYIDLSADGVTWQSGTVAVTMGALIGFSGQSLSVRFVKKVLDTTTLATLVSNGTILPITPYGRVFATYFDTSASYQPAPSAVVWELPADGGHYDSAFCAQYLNLQIALRGVPCGLIGNAVGSTPISAWQPGQTDNTNLLAILAAAGGAWEAFIEFIGHSDALAGTTYAAFQSGMAGFMGSITAANALGGYEQYYASIPYITSTAWGTPAQQVVIRQAMSDYADSLSAPYIAAPDLSTQDGVHENQVGAARLALEFYRAARPYFGKAGNQIGPILTSATRSATAAGNLVFNVTLQTGATALIQSGTQYSLRTQILNTGTTERWLNPTLAVAGSTLTMLDPIPGYSIDIAYNSTQGLANLDGSANMIYDNHIEADEAALGITIGRPMTAPNAIVTAPAVGNVTFDMTMQGTPGYATAAPNFGNAVTAGYGTTANLPMNQNATLECRANLGITAPIAASMLAFSQKGQLSVSTGGFLVVNVGSSTTTTASLIDGNWHHLELDMTPTGWQAFVDGVSVATGTISSGSNQSFGIPGLGAVRSLGTGGAQKPANGVLVDEMAVWKIVRHTTTFTPPTSPYVGNETGMVALYHFENTGADSCTN